MNNRLISRFDKAAQFRTGLTPETDRGCALMGGSYLDAQLEELLRAYFVDDTKVAGDLIGQSRPLATFSSRIDLTYMLGLISKSAHRDLHLVRKIRNEFGHTASPMDFETPSNKSRCKELIHDGLPQDAPARDKFQRAVMGLAASIDAALIMIDHRITRPDADFGERSRLNARNQLILDELLSDVLAGRVEIAGDPSNINDVREFIVLKIKEQLAELMTKNDAVQVHGSSSSEHEDEAVRSQDDDPEAASTPTPE